MSTPIWDSGDLIACTAAVRCDRCDALAVCVQLSTHGDQINVCVRFCFLELCHAVGTFAGDSIRAAMAAGLRGEPLQLDSPKDNRWETAPLPCCYGTLSEDGHEHHTDICPLRESPLARLMRDAADYDKGAAHFLTRFDKKT